MRALKIATPFAVVAVLAFSGAPPGSRVSLAQSAGTPEALAAARELNAILSKDVIKQLTTQVTGQVWPALEKNLRAKRQDVTDAQLAELRAEFERIQFENLSSVMDDAPIIYARHFTAAELREMLAFHRSPVGQKSLREMPQIMAESMALMMPRMQQLRAQTIEAFTKVLRQRGFAI